MSKASLVLETRRFGEFAELTILEGGELMLEVDGLSIFDLDGLKEFKEWLDQTIQDIEQKEV